MNWNIGPDIKIMNSLNGEMFNDILNFDIPPNGYIIIFSTSTPRILADIKWPSSWTIIRKLIIIKMEKDAVIIASKANIYTKGFISMYLYIVFIIQILPIFWKYHI